MSHHLRRQAARCACAAVVAALGAAAPAVAQQESTGGADAGHEPAAGQPAESGSAPSQTGTPPADPSAAAPAQSTPATAVRALRRGARGAAVRRLQRRLGLRADGVYGSRTVRAVKRFQLRKGLRANGVATGATLQALGLIRRPMQAPATAPAPADVAAILERIAQCESGGDPTAISPNGTYRGKYQFDRPTWRSVGGAGDPAAAEEVEQDQRAAQLYAKRGAAPWPVCGRKALQEQGDGAPAA